MQKELALVLYLAGTSVFADSAPYADQKRIRFESNKYTLHHYHNLALLDQSREFWTVYSNTDFMLTDANKASHLSLRERGNGKLKFRIPIGALTDIWLDEEHEIVVALSHIKNDTPYQLYILDFSGRILRKEKVESTHDQSPHPEFGIVSESATNFVFWYEDPPNPRIETSDNQTFLVIEELYKASYPDEYKDALLRIKIPMSNQSE